MQLIFLLVVLFVLGCLLYGIYAGVSAIGRIGAHMSDQEHEPMPLPLPNNAEAPPKNSRDYVAELQALFALHQSGALTAEEFEQLKKRLLTEIK